MGKQTKDPSANSPEVDIDIDGDVSGSVYVAGGNIVIATSPAKPSVHDLLKQALTMLSLSDYDATVEACTKILVDDAAHPEANLLAAVALMQGQGADRLRDNALRRVERHLKRAAAHPTMAATALAISGIVKYDHYIVHGLFEGEPSFKDIVHRLSEIGPSNINHDLMNHVKSSGGVRQRLGLE
jgi:hypothetical protein